MVKEHFRRLHPRPQLFRRTICHQLFEARILFLAVLAKDLGDKLRRVKQRDRIIDVTRKILNENWGEGAFKILTQQLVKSMSRAVPVQDFPWPIVEHRLHTFDLAP